MLRIWLSTPDRIGGSARTACASEAQVVVRAASHVSRVSVAETWFQPVK